MQWRAQFDAPLDDLTLFQSDDRRYDFDLRFRPRPHADQFLEHLVVFRPAVRIAGAVFRYRSDVDRSRADRFRPANRHGEKMRIAKGNVRHGNGAALGPGHAQFIFWNGNLFVRERGPANRTKVIELHDKPFAHAVEIRSVVERAPFALLRALAVTGVEQRDV